MRRLLNTRTIVVTVTAAAALSLAGAGTSQAAGASYPAGLAPAVTHGTDNTPWG
jgi:hypothetical protein